MSRVLPLRWRLPNPPAVFTGRAREIDAVAQMVDRAPVTVVWGLSGLGKSALVRRVVHARFGDHVARTIACRIAAPEALESLLLELVGVLAAARGVDVDRDALQADREALLAALLDLAEGGGRKRPYWVLIDDFEHADPEHARRLLTQMARYARASRWIVTSRIDPRSEALAGQVLALGAMDGEELRALARQLDPDPRRSEDAARRAGGSPWRLMQLLGGAAARSGPVAPAPGDDIGPLPEGTEPFLWRLALAQSELPDALLPAVPAAALDELARRGIVERGATGLRIHEVARSTIAARIAPEDGTRMRRELAAALASSSEPESLLEALRLWLTLDDVPAARALLERHSSLAIDHALALWHRLEGHDDERLASFRLRAIAELGDARAAATARLPDDPSPSDRLSWAKIRSLLGDHLGAAAEAERARADRDLAVQADLLAARAWLLAEHPERAAKVLEGLRDGLPPAEQALRDVDLAACLVQLGQRDRGLALCEAVEPRLRALPAPLEAELRFRIAGICARLGMLLRAEEVLAAQSRTSRLYVHDTGRRLCLRFGIAHQRGRPSEAKQALARLLPIAAHAPSLRWFARAYEAYLEATHGTLEGLVAQLDGWIAEAERQGASYVSLELVGLRHRVAIACGETSPPPMPAVEAHRPETHARVELGAALAAAHRGERPALGDDAELPTSEMRALAHLVRARIAIVADEPSLAHAQEALAESLRDGHRHMEADARVARCEALLWAGDLPELQREAERLGALAQQIESWLEDDATFFRMVAGNALSATSLATIARSPVARRRVAALFARSPHLDAVDEAVVAAAKRHAPWQLTGGDRRSEWGLDQRRTAVWIGPREIDMRARSVGWRLLTTLAASGGAATKEELVGRVWDTPDYHPLRDDNRLHAAVRKLRDVLDAPLLITRDDGYVLAAAPWVLQPR